MDVTSESLCIFCRIVTGQSEASVLYEDERILAFMNLRPVNPGEVLVIPKDHVDHFCDLSDELSSQIVVQAQRLSRNLMTRLKPRRVGLVVHGFGVAHAHLVVIPQHGPNDITSAKLGYVEEGQIKYDVERLPKPTPGGIEQDGASAVLSVLEYGEELSGLWTCTNAYQTT